MQCQVIFRKDADGVLITLVTTHRHTATTVYSVLLSFCGGVVASGTTKTRSAQMARDQAVVQDVAHGMEVHVAIVEMMAKVGAMSLLQIVRRAEEIS